MEQKHIMWIFIIWNRMYHHYYVGFLCATLKATVGCLYQLRRWNRYCTVLFWDFLELDYADDDRVRLLLWLLCGILRIDYFLGHFRDFGHSWLNWGTVIRLEPIFILRQLNIPHNSSHTIIRSPVETSRSVHHTAAAASIISITNDKCNKFSCEKIKVEHISEFTVRQLVKCHIDLMQ